MKKLLFSLFIILANAPFVHSQKSISDTLNPLGLHLGVNYGAGIAGGIVGGGGLKVCPRIGVNYKERLVLGLESNAGYQIVYEKDSLEPSIYLSRWVGPFVRYYFYPAKSKLNLLASVHYIFGSYYEYYKMEKFRATYNTAFLGLGMSYKVKNVHIEFGYRYTFLLNNTPIQAKETNTIFLGVTRNF
jgi:hypothetical protein